MIIPLKDYTDPNEINKEEENRRKHNRIIFIIIFILATGTFCYHVSTIIDRFLQNEVTALYNF